MVLGRCPAWAIAPAGETTSRIFAVRLPGAAAFQMNSTIIDEKLGTLRLESLVTVVGQDVFDLDATAVGRPVPGRPSVRTLTQELVARVQSR